MIISVLKRNSIHKFFLPSKVYGNYWITDEDNNNLINVEESNSNWKLKSNYETKIIQNGSFVDFVILEKYNFYYLKTENEKDPLILYVSPLYDESFAMYQIKQNCEIVIGSDNNAAISYQNKLVANNHCKLIYNNNKWAIQNLESKVTYVNEEQIDNAKLRYGDVIFIMGLKIIVMNNFIVANNPNGKARYSQNIFANYSVNLAPINKGLVVVDDEAYVEVYKDSDYFLRSPRFRTSIEKVTIAIDPPPAQSKPDETPAILTIGPMITMGMTSMVTVISALGNLSNGNGNSTTTIASLVVAGAMLASTLLWPSLTRKYQNMQREKLERERQKKYSHYIETKRVSIINTIKMQRQILIENNISLAECKNIIINKKRNLWEREKDQDDFLSVRLGIGTLPPEIDIKYPEEHFTMDEDNLKDSLQNLVTESKYMVDVPINMSFAKRNLTAIVGTNDFTKKFIDSLVLQLITFHGYDDLKFVIFTNDENKASWEYMKILPHTWSDDKSIRFFATDTDEMKQVSSYLEKEFYYRKYKSDDSHEELGLDYKSFSSYYIIIVDNLKMARNIEIIKNVLEQKTNIGFSLIIRNDRLSNLPNECNTFINVSESGSGLFENELISNKQKEFVAEINNSVDMMECALKLANVPIEIEKSGITANLPNTVTFLEMYNVGTVEQLNALNRWQVNNPTISLQVPVGIDQSGELFKLDLHEKFHGPHGLVAGMTGSGKSEFIISYILSLATNFHPYEVSFILIDYKGGGLAGAFKNKDTGVILPHLAGTITNLDTVEMNRSLASIESELKRRQKIFNEARDTLNESTIDIYKYQRLYRDKMVKDPVSHLFIICDEFAELKVQQPDFMAQLISTARIGRSLGVHLILATQKPSGVVDDQIWSNSKFRICLKVQDKSDSMDMIKCPDAAMLTQVGRFYLQVGYNEFFALGQSAWCGAQYIPTDKLKKKVDNAIDIIDNTGAIIKSIDEGKKIKQIESKGEELPNIVKYLSDIAVRESIKIRQLWLDRIPDFIFVENLKKKYKYAPERFVINPIIGEFDDPNNQRQELLTLPLSTEGNTILYGSAGSGIEEMLTTIVYSCITNYSVKEVNFYIMDFGSETLRIFNQAPQVGDVLFLNDVEKISNLFKMIKQIIDDRKKLFLNYNGSQQFYCKNSGNSVPTIVIMINNYEAFSETYDEFSDVMMQFTREGFKYGIIFILTASGSSSIRYRLRQNFKQELVLQLNDESDYSSILGNTHKKYPSKIVGRGLIRLDDLYEFQVAYPYEVEKLNDYLKEICNNLKKSTSIRAEHVPILPDKVTLSYVEGYLKGINMIPVGVEKDSLKVSTFDFQIKYISLISGIDIEEISSFASTLLKELATVKEVQLIAIDSDNNIKAKNINYPIYKENFDEVFNNLNNYIEQVYKIYADNNFKRESLIKCTKVICVILGLETFKSRLNPDNKTKFDKAIEKAKDLGIINFVLIDSIDKLKKFEYESWYKTTVSNNHAIWVGNGIADQFSIKLTKTPRELRDTINKGFGYSIKNGIATLIKLIEEDDINEK